MVGVIRGVYVDSYRGGKGMAIRATSHVSREPWLWNRESPKESVQRPVPTHLRDHVVWSWAFRCGVKSCVTVPSTKCYFDDFLFVRGPHTSQNMIIQPTVVRFQSAVVSRFCVRPTSKRWLLKIAQVTMKHDPFWGHVGIYVDFTSILHSLTRLVPRA